MCSGCSSEGITRPIFQCSFPILDNIESKYYLNFVLISDLISKAEGDPTEESAEDDVKKQDLHQCE